MCTDTITKVYRNDHAPFTTVLFFLEARYEKTNMANSFHILSARVYELYFTSLPVKLVRILLEHSHSLS